MEWGFLSSLVSGACMTTSNGKKTEKVSSLHRDGSRYGSDYTDSFMSKPHEFPRVVLSLVYDVCGNNLFTMLSVFYIHTFKHDGYYKENIHLSSSSFFSIA